MPFEAKDKAFQGASEAREGGSQLFANNEPTKNFLERDPFIQHVGTLGLDDPKLNTELTAFYRVIASGGATGPRGPQISGDDGSWGVALFRIGLIGLSAAAIVGTIFGIVRSLV